MSKKLKFSLELNENGDLKIDIEGNGMEIGEKLFLPFFFFVNIIPISAILFCLI